MFASLSRYMIDVLYNYIKIQKNSLMAKIFPANETIGVNSLHHQSVNRLAEGFEVDAFHDGYSGTFDVVVVTNADGTFSVPGCGKRDYTYAEMTGTGTAGDPEMHWASY